VDTGPTLPPLQVTEEEQTSNILEGIQTLYSLHYKYHFGGAEYQYLGVDTDPSLPPLQVTVKEHNNNI
jgi:hypothetical protein